MKCIIAGSRNITDRTLIDKAINASGWVNEIDEVVSGKASGVDTLGEMWADTHNITIKSFPADWKNIDVPIVVVKENKYGKYNALAGFNRNQQMAEYADALIAIIKNNSSGTRDMIERMNKLNKKVYVLEV